MPVVGSAQQQPADTLDWDIDFGEFFPPDDVITDAVVTAEPAMTPPPTVAVRGNVLKVWVYAGSAEGAYKLTVRATTNDGRIKEVEMKLKLKDD